MRIHVKLLALDTYLAIIIHGSIGERRASLVAQTVKESACNAEDLGSVPGLGRSLGKGNKYSPQ